MSILLLTLSNSLMMPNHEKAITLFSLENLITVIVHWQPGLTETEQQSYY